MMIMTEQKEKKEEERQRLFNPPIFFQKYLNVFLAPEGENMIFP